MTPAPNSRPPLEQFEAALKALPDDLPHFRGQMLDFLRLTWDRIDPDDLRWKAIEALLILDDPGDHNLSSNLQGAVAVVGATTRLLEALLEVDADQGGSGVMWINMRRAKIALDDLPEAFRGLEEELYDLAEDAESARAAS